LADYSNVKANGVYKLDNILIKHNKTANYTCTLQYL